MRVLEHRANRDGELLAALALIALEQAGAALSSDPTDLDGAAMAAEWSIAPSNTLKVLAALLVGIEHRLVGVE